MVETREAPAQIELVAGRACLDFANHRERVLERADAYGALVAYALESDLIDADEAERLVSSAGDRPAEADAVIHRAHVLARAVRHVFEALAAGDSPSTRWLRLLNREIRNAGARVEIVAHDGSYEWGWHTPRPLSLDRPLWPVAGDAADLLATENPCRFKVCGAASCRWLFFDTSKNCSRRWCDMATCGNRAKARRFRQRQAIV